MGAVLFPESAPRFQSVGSVGGFQESEFVDG
jgi:hypothetical protein